MNLCRCFQRSIGVGWVSNPPNFNLAPRLLPGVQKRMPEQQNAAHDALLHIQTQNIECFHFSA